MVVEKLPEVNPPSDRMPGRGLLVLPIFGAWRRRNREVFRDAGFSPRVSSMRGKFRPKGGYRGHLGLPGALVAQTGVGPRHLATWAPGGAPWPSVGVPE